jgi:hypothetical protein
MKKSYWKLDFQKIVFDYSPGIQRFLDWIRLPRFIIQIFVLGIKQLVILVYWSFSFTMHWKLLVNLVGIPIYLSSLYKSVRSMLCLIWWIPPKEFLLQQRQLLLNCCCSCSLFFRVQGSEWCIRRNGDRKRRSWGQPEEEDFAGAKVSWLLSEHSTMFKIFCDPRIEISMPNNPHYHISKVSLVSPMARNGC